MNTLQRILINTISILVVAYFLPGIILHQTFDAFILAVVLAVLNALVKPVLTILTFPLTILTFGLFLWVLNGLMILLADFFIDGVEVRSLGTAMIFSLLIGLLNWILGARDLKR